MFKKLAKYVKEYKKSAILTPIFVVLEVVMEVIIPLLMSKIIDVGIPNNDIRNLSFFTKDKFRSSVFISSGDEPLLPRMWDDKSNSIYFTI